MATVNPKFGKELKKFGGFDFNACYNCGNCTAVCSLSTEDSSFPRELVRLSVVGLDSEIKTSLKPWECYYCGDCSTHCPQEADPGELMMTLRRWLTSQYDWTGLSGLFYKYVWAFVIALFAVFAGVIYFANNVVAWELDKMLHFGHYFEMIAIGSISVVIFLPNLLRMWYFTIVKPGVKVPFKDYFTTLGELFVHMFTQKRAKDCDDNHFRWLEHLILVFAYLALLFTTVFLDWFGTSSLFVIVLGYVESLLIFVITFDFVKDRMQKRKALAKKSQPSDWFFVIWLLLMGLSAFLVRLFIDINLLEANKWIYIIHLTVLAQWALLIVPFGKWTHFLYRSFAMYFAKLKEKVK